ncbi:uncharacterized protein LOC129617257 [Condylostylus longicornis]|uniref:uncharacterized protein LOC129617257 n=1 Tax=Condylostylus longicornis TaxID=2530218 RepID=UPI00244E530C|nr:uncharacterized protein LOC129617257 [Condylostylus longicornis]
MDFDNSMTDFDNSMINSISRRHYGIEVDIWAAGVIVYLLIYGEYPFNGVLREDEIFPKIQDSDLVFPPRRHNSPSNLALDFMRRCLCKNPKERITAAEALEHPWLRDKNSSLSQDAYPLIDEEIISKINPDL